MAAILSLLMLLVAAGTWQMREGARFEAALAEIARSGERATASELEEFYVAPTAQEDATQLWLDGSAPFVLPAFADAAKDLPFVGNETKVPPPGIPWADLAAAEKLLRQSQPSLSLFHAALGGSARYPTKFAQGVASPLPHLQNLRMAYRLLALEAHVRAHRGDARGAAQSIEAILGLGRSLENEPLAISQFVRMACDEAARRHLSELLPYVPFADQELIRLQGLLQQVEYRSGLRRALLGERVIVQQELNEMPGAILVLSGVRQVHLHFMARLLEIAEHPFPQALDEMRDLQAELTANSDAAMDLGKMKYVLPALAGESLQHSFTAAARNRAHNDAAIAMIAIERYRRQHDALPTDLAQLVPDFLPAVALDPFDGRPLRYVLSGDEYLIYNVGSDGVDNGGQGDDSGKPDDVLRITIEPRGKSNP